MMQVYLLPLKLFENDSRIKFRNVVDPDENISLIKIILVFSVETSLLINNKLNNMMCIESKIKNIKFKYGVNNRASL